MFKSWENPKREPDAAIHRRVVSRVADDARGVVPPDDIGGTLRAHRLYAMVRGVA